ncbi:MAG: MGMT family protein [Muribaculaceae bacterium]|nr:MGMT family protein [Muribaculaceae bacterium]
MKSINISSDFVDDVRNIVSSIPMGKVLTYGDVAALACRPSNARQVGKILASFGFVSDIPCHRVVNFQGRTAPHWPGQVALLKEEGVTFKQSNIVNMYLHHWIPQ